MRRTAPQKFARWLAQHEHRDKQFGFVYHYHPRSDAHSIALCRFILEDLLEHSAVLKKQALSGSVIYGINYSHRWSDTGKVKTLDLAIGTGTADTTLPSAVAGINRGTIDRLLIACEGKTVMTEHSKSQPRIYDELSSSHEIVHQGEREAIAAGIAVVNIADTFVSPLRQKGVELHISKHKQPKAAVSMLSHLRGLPIRDDAQAVGFDAFASVVIKCDNQSPATLWRKPPAPQPGDPDDYGTFLARISRVYAERFGK